MAQAGQSRSSRPELPREDRQIVVLFDATVARARMPSGASRPGLKLQALLADGRARTVSLGVHGRRAAASEGGTPAIHVVAGPGGHETEYLLRELQHENPLARVYLAPPRWPQHRGTGAFGGVGPVPMDHWGMRMAGVDTPHDASSIQVAVVDTGVDRSHPDLAAAIDDYVNCCNGESDEDFQQHGTHVCGILAGAGQPPAGMRGASNARLLVFKGLARQYDATAYYRALGSAFARAPIVNLSLGGPDFDPAEELLIRQALAARVLVVAASGNDGDDGSRPNYPAHLDGVVAVGAIDSSGRKAGFSNAGPHLALVAPGVEVWSTVPTGPSPAAGAAPYAPLSGTSMAAPFVSAVAARVAATEAVQGPALRDRLPLRRCPGQTQRNDDLGAGCVRWGGPLTLGRA